jgi:hypothetical protein
MIYTRIETAKLIGVDPKAWFADLLPASLTIPFIASMTCCHGTGGPRAHQRLQKKQPDRSSRARLDTPAVLAGCLLETEWGGVRYDLPFGWSFTGAYYHLSQN